ncbi:MAG: hypothetical protein WD449_01385 [Candidatus Babeliales bacterium]
MEKKSAQVYAQAWEQLYTYIVHGKKEHAFGLFKLLKHQMPDKAFALQLEGDMLLACGDAQALAKYEQAITLYQKEGRSKEADAVAHYVVMLKG